jgi:uncharacterized protein (TIGR02996 family)
MTSEQTLLQALHADPGDDTAWLALADCLEEQGQTERAELLRLHRAVRGLAWGRRRHRLEARIRALVEAGVRPCVPVLVNSIGMQLVLISVGTFVMGSPKSEHGRNGDEEVQHEVEITRAFYLGACPVTQSQWQQIMGNNPSYFCRERDGRDMVAGMDTRDFPVEDVEWDDVTAFLDKLSALEAERQAGRTYRLPTEAEWEYACRGGASSSMPFHHGRRLSATQANHDHDLARTSRVGSYPPNAFGLYDMHGNVWEWCQDWFDPAYYPRSPRQDPPGPTEGSGRVVRGGCWSNSSEQCRSAHRYSYALSSWVGGLGFRVALSPFTASVNFDPH